MWLDEALSVSISRLPVPDLLEALRQDGSPPLYYLLLHMWMDFFGTGNDTVRAFSTLCSLLALPLAYLVGRRLGGERAGAAALLLFAASPFAIRYATEARMYALVMLLALLGILAVLYALERPTVGRLWLVAAAAGLLALTHYWALFFLAAGEVLLLVRARRDGWRGSATRVAIALPCGAGFFLPWLPSFIFQTQHTGTPWAPAPSFLDFINTVHEWAGPDLLGLVLSLLLVGLAVRGWGDRKGQQLLLLGVGALVLGFAVSRLGGAGYALRYSAAVLVPVLLAAAIGAARLRERTFQIVSAVAGVLALAVVSFTPLLGSRTQAADTAALLNQYVREDDVVVYCPDQLGPAVARLLPSDVHQVVYPTMGPPQRIDWVDYASRNATASPSAFAEAISASTTGSVWLVADYDYLTFDSQCVNLNYYLAGLRGSRVVLQEPAEDVEESQWLLRYPAARADSSSFSGSDPR
jgi:hypothetical protein